VTTLIQGFPGFFAALFNYIRLLLLPLGLHMEYGKKLFSFADHRVLSGLLLFCVLSAFAASKRKKAALPSFCVGWFLVALVPQANIYPINAYMAEHWLYVPSIGYFLLLAYGLRRLCAARALSKAGYLAISASIISYSYLTIQYNSFWREPISFYERTLHYAPDSARVHNNLGLAYHDMGNKQKAIQFYDKAIALDPGNAEVHFNLANTLEDIGNSPEAIALYKKALSLNPNYGAAYNNLGFVYVSLGREAEAFDLFKRSVQVSPNYAEAHVNMGFLNLKYRNAAQAWITCWKPSPSVKPCAPSSTVQESAQRSNGASWACPFPPKPCWFSSVLLCCPSIKFCVKTVNRPFLRSFVPIQFIPCFHKKNYFHYINLVFPPQNRTKPIINFCQREYTLFASV